MDNKFNEITEGRWVEEKMSRLEPSDDWQPDVEKAFQRLSQKERSSGTPRWARLSMAAALGAIACGVVLALPWQVLWNPASQPVESPKSQLDTMPAQQPIAPIQIPSLTVPAPITSEPLREHAEPIELGAVGGVRGGYVLEREIAHTPPPPLPKGAVSVGDGVTAPVVISQVTPTYSEEARAVRIQGTVELLVVIREDGTAQIREVTRSLGYGLDEAAADAVAQWRFSPATKNGQPVPAFTSIQVSFTLR